jgi:hypothetical protein
MVQAGYPNPGSPLADGDVKALWRRPAPMEATKWQWLALVHLRAFSVTRLGVLVSFQGEAEPLQMFLKMKYLADEGRDKFRYDLLCPRIERVHIFG